MLGDKTNRFYDLIPHADDSYFYPCSPEELELEAACDSLRWESLADNYPCQGGIMYFNRVVVELDPDEKPVLVPLDKYGEPILANQRAAKNSLTLI